MMPLLYNFCFIWVKFEFVRSSHISNFHVSLLKRTKIVNSRTRPSETLSSFLQFLQGLQHLSVYLSSSWLSFYNRNEVRQLDQQWTHLGIYLCRYPMDSIHPQFQLHLTTLFCPEGFPRFHLDKRESHVFLCVSQCGGIDQVEYVWYNTTARASLIVIARCNKKC